MRPHIYILIFFLLSALGAGASVTPVRDPATAVIETAIADVGEAVPDTTVIAMLRPKMSKGLRPSIYALPYSLQGQSPHWKELWINTGVFVTAFAGTLVVLECLPEGATNWNRASIENTPWYRRWWNNVVRKGPEWDGDDYIFNYIMHPYAGAVYFMSARSCGFNFYRSLLYCSLISTVGWEFGIEGTMERPSLQDIFITSVVGSCLGELFYILKRHIVRNGYRLFGSPVLGNIAAFIIDPVNEVVGLFGGNDARHVATRYGLRSTLVPRIGKGTAGFALTCTF